MKRIGLFGGSYNPIHNGHIAIGRTMLKAMELDEVWYMVSPQNPWKRGDSDLAPEQVRYEITKAALDGEEGLIASDYEFHLPRPSYTWNTLQHLEQDYPDHRFVLIIGGDNWGRFPQWAHAEDIMQRYQIAVFPRSHAQSSKLKDQSSKLNARKGDHEALADVAPAGRHSDSGSIKRVGEANAQSLKRNAKCFMVNVPLINITSTDIRRMLRNGEDVSDLVPKNILHMLSPWQIEN